MLPSFLTDTDTNRLEYIPKKRMEFAPKRRHKRHFLDTISESTASEKSYAPLCTQEEILEFIVFLNFDVDWIFYTIIANSLLFIFSSYELIFDGNVRTLTVIILIKVLCNLVLVLDTIAMCLYYAKKHIRIRVPYERINTWIIIIQLTSIISVPLSAIRLFYSRDIIICLILMMDTARFSKIFLCTSLLRDLPRKLNVKVLLKIYITCLVVIIHVYACLWMCLACLDTNGKCNKDPRGIKYWNKSGYLRLLSIGENKTLHEEDVITKPAIYFILSLYYVVGSLTSTGYGGASNQNNLEAILCISLMITHLIVIKGLCVSDFTNYQIQRNKFEKQMMQRLNMMQTDLERNRYISRNLRKFILKYHKDFWNKDNAVKTSALLDVVPNSIYCEIQMEKYWYAIQKCQIFNSTSEAFKRAIATSMRCEIFNQGDILYELGQMADTMVYIARGTIQILSFDDGESPVVTLGKGTCLGQNCLQYSYKTRIKVSVATYSVVYILDKSALWKVVRNYYKLKQGPILRQAFKKMIDVGKELKAHREKNYNTTIIRKWKCVESKKILTEFKERIRNELIQLETFSGSLENIDDLAIDKLYMYSELYNDQRAYDEIFLRTRWPWILQPQSQLLKAWDTCMTVILLYVAVYYPYLIAFHPQDLFSTLITSDVICFSYIFDVILQVFTAIETKTAIKWKVNEILLARLEKITFVLDICAAFPFHWIAIFINNRRKAGRFLSILCLSRLFKLYKVHYIFHYLEISLRIETLLIKLFKYAIYLMYIGYLFSSFYYMISCFNATHCNYNSWAEATKRVYSRLAGYSEKYKPKSMFSYVFTQTLLVVSSTSRPLAVNINEFLGVVIFSLVGVCMYCYSTSEYSAKKSLDEFPVTKYWEFMDVVKKYMSDKNIPKTIFDRVNYYLSSEWDYNRGVTNEILYCDSPAHLSELRKISKHGSELKQAQFFEFLEPNVINIIANLSHEMYLPPHEYVIYAGERARFLYIVLRGYCRILEANVSKRVLGPHAFVNGAETVLGLQSAFTIRSQTHTVLLAINGNDLKAVFTKYPHIQQHIVKSAEDMIAKRIFTTNVDVATEKIETVHKKKPSWFVFPPYKRHPLNIDYKYVYERSSWRITRYVLMRRTLLPDGKFLEYWEIGRAICAFIIAILGPANIVYIYYWPSTKYFIYLLQVTSIMDIYLRFHVCYYNKKGILVTHPQYTAWHYLTHAFLLDLTAMLPLTWVLSTFSNIKQTKLILIFQFNVLLQMYRFPDAFKSNRNPLHKTDTVLLHILKCLPFTLIIMHTLACMLLFMSGDITLVDGKIVFQIETFTWISTEIGNPRRVMSYKPTELENYYFICFYFVVVTTMKTGFNQFRCISVGESWFQVTCIVLGYVLGTYIFVSLAHSRYVINNKLTLHQNYMAQMVQHMKHEDIPKKIQTAVIDYFELIWRMTNGVKPHFFLSKFHLPLQTECICYIYQKTIQNVPIFEDTNKSFLRLFGMNVQEVYLKKGARFIQLNDLVKDLYIVHGGLVVAYGPCDQVFCHLGQGSIIGNIDNVECTRSMITYVTSTTTDLLKINTKIFYKILDEFPTVCNKLERHILLENLSYIESSGIVSFKDRMEAQESASNRFTEIISKEYISWLMVFVSLASCMVASFQMAFSSEQFWYFILYFFDLMHIVKIWLNFYRPYYDNRGDIVTDRQKIKKRYMTFTKFYFDCVTLFPFDIFCLIVSYEERENYRLLIGLYRILRALNVYQFFDKSENKLNTSHMLVRLGPLLTYIILAVHVGACALYITACPNKKCNTDSWVYIKHDTKKIGNPYIWSLYYMMSVFTSTGDGGFVPRSRLDMVCAIIISIFSKYIVAIFVGDVTAIIRNTGYSLTKYNFQLKTLTIYLENSFVSGPFLQKIKEYCSHLWIIGKGRQVPTLWNDCPQYLLEEIKTAAYGKHIYNNLIFAKCHPDFLRNLIRKLRVQTFFVGDTICQQEDINDTMFFIHKGIVNVYSINASEEIYVDELCELDCFGVIQGLFPSTPHTHTYRANAVTVVITLSYENWSKLLRFFPASKFAIYQNLRVLEEEEGL